MHLERAASLEEPEDPKSKAHYFDGLLLLARYEFELYITCCLENCKIIMFRATPLVPK